MGDAQEPFGDWLRGQISHRGWSVPAFAARVGVSKQSVYRYVKGEQRPDPEFIPAIAAALGLRVEVVNAAAYGHQVTGPPARFEVAERLRQLEQDNQVLASNVQRLREAVETEAVGVVVPVIARVPSAGLRWEGGKELQPVRVLEEDLRGARSPIGLLVTDNCMRLIGVLAGDVIVCEQDPDRKPIDGELVVVQVGEHLVFRRWHVVDRNTVELRDAEGKSCQRLNPVMDDYIIEGFYLVTKQLAQR